MLILVMALVGCANETDTAEDTGDTSEDTGDTGEEAPSVEAALPDGLWGGTVAWDCGADGAGSSAYEVSIADNRLTTLFDDGEFEGVALDVFRYVAAGQVEWLDYNGERVIGDCTAVGAVLTCQTRESQTVQEARTLTFGPDTLTWAAEVTLESTCVSSGVLQEE